MQLKQRSFLTLKDFTGKEIRHLIALASELKSAKRGGYEQRIVRPDEEALEVVSEFQRRLDEIIELGFFPASPMPPLGCRFCDYLPVCGPRAEISAERKQADPRLSPLNWLRNLR